MSVSVMDAILRSIIKKKFKCHSCENSLCASIDVSEESLDSKEEYEEELNKLNAVKMVCPLCGASAGSIKDSMVWN